MKFLEIFDPIQKGSHGFTDEAIYSSIRNGDKIIPLYGGNNQHFYTERYVSNKTITKDGREIRIFSGEGIIISLDGSAGCMTYKNGETFTLNHHAGFIKLKKGHERDINLLFFSLFYQNHYKSLSVSDGSKTLSLDQIYNDEIELPSKYVQDSIINKLNPVYLRINSFKKLLERLKNLLLKEIEIEYSDYQIRNISVNDCLGHESGYSDLTEEFIYSKLLCPGEKYKVRSSSTSDETLIGYIAPCLIKEKPIRINNRKETLLIARNGTYVGQTEYLVDEKYTINDHAYILYVKDECEYKINLKWFSIQYRSEIMNYASKSANGTWNMTGFFKNVLIDIPSYQNQLKVVEIYEKAEGLIKKISKLLLLFNRLLEREIKTDVDFIYSPEREEKNEIIFNQENDNNIIPPLNGEIETIAVEDAQYVMPVLENVLKPVDGPTNVSITVNINKFEKNVGAVIQTGGTQNINELIEIKKEE